MAKLHRLIAALALAGFAAPALAQQPAKTSAWVTPRTSDGHPDLQGDWTNSSITVLERTNAKQLGIVAQDRSTETIEPSRRPLETHVTHGRENGTA